MSLSVSQRLARAAFGAAVSTFVALGSHLVGGADAPSLAGWAVPLVLSFAVCVQFAGRELSLWRLAIAVSVSQALFHTMFMIGSGAASLSSDGHAHHGSAVAVTVVDDAAHGAHSDAGMTLAHVGAAILTTLALHRAEWLLARGAALLSWLRTALHVAEPGALPPFGDPRTQPIPAQGSARVLEDVASGVYTRRGPPLFV